MLKGCPAGERDVVVTIDADLCFHETSWDIVIASTSTVVASIGSLPNDGVHSWSNCLPAGDYTFTIYDSYGDGMAPKSSKAPSSQAPNSTNPNGSYKLSVDGDQKFNVNGIDFGASDSRDFTVPSVSTNETILICNIYNCKYSHD